MTSSMSDARQTADEPELREKVRSTEDEAKAEIERLQGELDITKRQRDESVKAEAAMRVIKTSHEAMVKGVWKQHEEQFSEQKAKLDEAVRLLYKLSNNCDCEKCATAKAFLSTFKGPKP